MDSQNKRILEHLRSNPITPMEALVMYGIMRLGARIYDLKCMGYTIKTDMVSAKNRFGYHKRFACYTLIKESDK